MEPYRIKGTLLKALCQAERSNVFFRSKKVKSEDTCDHSDKGEEDVEEEEARKIRLGLNKKSGDDDELIAKGKSYVNSCT
ncbi:uncharacterized protein A4U43_C07F30610 [Asparagus officinalis]|uniref:Uncharacterized protein n=1 Tax=Asparagus officinalis TaxID=4686 RepID=A0A5P1EG22_ASPOF|nr:uncharacterized protein A4U43_C07F30610 [Asparagus officinalis]